MVNSIVLSEVGPTVSVDPFVYIDKNVKIGERVKIHAHVTIAEGVEIGDDVEIFPGAYIGKPPRGPRLESAAHFGKKVVIGKQSVIGPNAIIYYGDCVGERTLIGDGVSIRENVVIGNGCIIGRNATINYATVIGENVKVMDLAHITANMQIGDNAFIGPHVCCADDNKFGKDKNESPEEIGGAIVGEDANIGEAAVLLPCVKIGKRATVAAGAVVTHDIEADSTVMGIPARKI